MNIQQLFKLGMKRDIPDLIEVDHPLALNLGAGNHVIPGAIPLGLPKWNADDSRIPYDAGAVGTIHAYHFLEHLHYPIRALREMERVLIVGGVANIVVPYYTSQMMAQDLTHRHPFCEATWANTFNNQFYGDHERWRFRVGVNIIIGIAERNLALMTQLIKE